ncbi:MAG: sulfotransferase family protein [Bacteroidota bacterium]
MAKIHLVSSPRNLSTALMYAFAQRKDMKVVDEPLYAHYLSVSRKQHPGREAILRVQNPDGMEVLKEMAEKTYGKPHVFFKGMAKHLIELDWKKLLNFTTIIYLRNPHQLIASFAKVIDHPKIHDIGIDIQYQLFTFLRNNGVQPIILDSAELLAAPAQVLERICKTIGIEFDPAMLSWEAGPRSEDGVWAPYWYKNVHASTGFQKQATSDRPLPQSLTSLYEACLPYYQEMLAYGQEALSTKHTSSTHSDLSP